MELQETIWLFGALAAIFSALSAWLSYKKSDGVERAQLYLSLRDRYLEIRRRVPDAAFTKEWDLEKNPKSKVELEQYWYNAFDEWYSTNKLNGGRHKVLWSDYFGPAITFTLKFPGPVEVLEDMILGSVSFGTYRKEFSGIIVEMNKSLEKDDRAKEQFRWELPN